MFDGKQSPRLTPSHILTAGLVVQLLSAVSLWQHNSSSTAILGRFSSRYAVVLLLHALVLIGWGAAIWQRQRLDQALRRIPERWRYSFIAAGGALVLIVWLSAIEEVIKAYLTVTWLSAAFTVLVGLADARVRWRRWPVVLVVLLLFMLFPMYIGALADRHFEPDEAAWADRSEAIFAAGGLYTRTYYWPETTIMPGYGWLHAGYGWLLHHVALDIGVGRTWQFVSYLIAFAGIGAIANRLYGRAVALAAVAFAVLSQTFIPIEEYRGNLQIPAAATWLVFAALQARYTTRVAAVWHFACGLLATLSLQIHASGIIFAFAMALFYSAEWVWRSYRSRRLASLKPLIAVGLGMLLGTTIFYLFNILPYGGITAYLQKLGGERGTSHEFLPALQRLLTWPSMIEGALVLFGLIFILWRRAAADQRFLSLFVCILIGAFLFDTQGYLQTFNAFLVIPAGVLLINGFETPGIPPGQNRRSLLAVGISTFALALQMVGLFLWNPGVWNWFRTGQLPPFLYKDIVPVLEPYIRADDTIVSTHQLFWGFPHANLISHIAAGQHIASRQAAKNGPFERETDLWEDVHPTLIIYIENEMHFDLGLQDYMEQHRFQVCKELKFMERDIRLYRTDCSSN